MKKSMIMDDNELKAAVSKFTSKELREINEWLSKIIFGYQNFSKDEKAFPIEVEAGDEKTLDLIEGILSRADSYSHPHNFLRWSDDGKYLVDFGKKEDDWLEYSSLHTLKRIQQEVRNQIANQLETKLKLSYTNGWLHVTYIKPNGTVVKAKFTAKSNNAILLDLLIKSHKLNLVDIEKKFNEVRKHADEPEPEKRVHDVIGYIREQLSIEANSPEDIFSVADKQCELLVQVE